MTRSLDNLFDEPQRGAEHRPSAPAGNDFDALLDEKQIETKDAIDPSWDKVRTGNVAPVPGGAPGLQEESGSGSTLEEEGLDDLMGMTAGGPKAKSVLKRDSFPPEPSLSREGDVEAGFPWWVVVAAIVLILAGAAAIVTFA